MQMIRFRSVRMKNYNNIILWWLRTVKTPIMPCIFRSYRNIKDITEARKRANKKYNDRFVEIKVRVTPEKRSIIKDHAESMGESATAFINRAIDEAMARDQKTDPEN